MSDDEMNARSVVEDQEDSEELEQAPTPRRLAVLSLRSAGVKYQRGGGFLGRGRKVYWALHDVTLNVYRGETLGVIGRNGAGKSTLLRLLAGIIRPDRGSYVNYGYKATLLSLQVGFIPYLTGRENVVLSGMLLGMGKREVETNMASIVAFAELEDFIDEPIRTYSSGMRARLGFSTAFHVDPDILLIDEVLGVGDAEFVAKSKAVMRERIRSDKTAILVSHSLEAIRSLCDRVVWVERGRSILTGETEAVLRAYNESMRGPAVATESSASASSSS